MATLIRLPPALRTGIATTPPLSRGLHTTSPSRASVLFALHALSNSRETQHFNKLSNLRRTEHSPPLKLIQTSEIDPFPLPNPPKVRPSTPLPPSTSSNSLPDWDRRALLAGRALLSAHARRVEGLTRSLRHAHMKSQNTREVLARARSEWEGERAKMANDLRVAGAWIVGAIGVATGLALWRFWPERDAVDSGRLGRKLAERARGAMAPLPAVKTGSAVEGTVGAVAEGVGLPVAARSAVPVVEVQEQGKLIDKGASWWKGLFWVQA